MNKIVNPILKGFNPDPSIIRVGDDFYIATSTFEWFPGVQIHHSKDLVNWELITHPLQNTQQLDLKGVPDSCGVWAPCLSYSDGVFYLVYSNVKNFEGPWKDTPNFLITTNDIRGEWSKPTYLDSSGFDGSLFHDEDGRKYYLSMEIDHRKGKFFGGIIIQEFSVEQNKLIGKKKLIYEGSELGLTEGPHIYKKDGYYYLLTAEGGTEYNHAVSIARSKSLLGPYETMPNNPLISSKSFPNNELQKAGHGDLFQLKNGDWYCVFLVGRPLEPLGKCTLGRETAIEKIIWEEGEWPRTASGQKAPRLEIENPFDIEKRESSLLFEDFENEQLNIHLSSLRYPLSEEWVSVKERESWLKISGRGSLSSFHETSMIAKRVQSHNAFVKTRIDFQPHHFQQMAGLTCYYNTQHFYYFYITTHNEGQTKVLELIQANRFMIEEIEVEKVELEFEEVVELMVEFKNDSIQFFYQRDEFSSPKPFGPVLDAGILSDDYIQSDGTGRYRPAFTGSFIGMCCQDLTGGKLPAFFDYYSYKDVEMEYSSTINELSKENF